MPRFSVIIPHYQGSISHELLCRAVHSLEEQTYKDYEILCYHDGPLLDRSLPMPVPIRETAERYGDMGHSLRDRGIREATGDYIVHLNSDNLLYPRALEAIAKELDRPPRWVTDSGQVLDDSNIVIFPILMRGMQSVHSSLLRCHDPEVCTILTGTPPVRFNIDCLQLVMRRSLWLKEGGWHDKRNESDGFLYEQFARKYGYRTCCQILGEHW
jgi:glycosyltransferase involved in cell wall biosynthesis